MPNINDLKKNNINVPNRQQPSTIDNNISIDMTSSKNIDNSIKHNETVYNNSPKGKTVVNQPDKVKGPDGRVVSRNNINPNRPNTNNRVSFDLSQLPKEKPSEDIHTSIEDDILTGKNPILFDYIKEKKAEMEQWVADKEDEQKLKEVITPTTNSEVSIDLTQPNQNNTSVSEVTNINDDLSFDRFEKETTNEKEDYNIMELDLGDNNMDNDELINVNDDIEVDDDFIEVNNEENEQTDDFILDPISTIDEVVEEPIVEEKEETIEPTVETVSVEEKKEEVKPELVSSDGIEFEAKDSIKEQILVEDENDPQNTEKEDLDASAKHLIELATKALKPAAKKVDLSSFTVVKKPSASVKFLEHKSINVAKWVLRTKKVCIHMKAAQGSELEELRTLMTDADVASDFIRMYRIIYDHVVSPKPDSFEAWTKSTFINDLDDYFFCFFIANYMGSNYIPYDCPNTSCKFGTFLSDNIPIMNMVKFGSDKDKEEFNNIYRSEIFDNNKGLYVTERIPFSDKLAIDFKQTTLYSFIEAQSVRSNEAFTNKYSTTIALTPSIDTIYAIDMDNQELNPVDYKVFPNNNTNTYKSKIQKYDSVLKSLDPDEFSALASYVASLTTDTKNMIDIKYVRPAADCPECGAHVDEVETSAQSLVFFRYQLGQMVNISTK